MIPMTFPERLYRTLEAIRACKVYDKETIRQIRNNAKNMEDRHEYNVFKQAFENYENFQYVNELEWIEQNPKVRESEFF